MNIFIDLGSHYGNVIRRFMNSPSFSSDFIIYAFEPNPIITETVFMQYPKCVTIYRKAAWLFDGELDFFINPHPGNQGASVLKEKSTNNLDKEHPVKIQCLDFSAWMQKFLREEDNVIVKCNIEGAEYALFDKLMNDGTIMFIKKLYLSRHWHKLGMSNDDVFMQRLLSYKHLTVISGNKNI